jgi:hypothetical protein
VRHDGRMLTLVSMIVRSRPAVRQARARRELFARYAVACVYLASVCAAEIVYSLLSHHDQQAVLAWASTNIHNLPRDPVGCMIASAFFPAASLLAWPGLIALTMFPANGILGNWRTVLVCGAGHVIGTLVSEGILWYQIVHGTMPASDRLITDVGPSYVVVTAIAVCLVWGSWLARASAGVAFLLLIFVGQIFAGISNLSLSPVGHATALFTGLTLGSLVVWRRRRAMGPAQAALASSETS